MVSLAPNNASSWNYLRGMLDHTKIPYPTFKAFVELYTVDRYDGSDDVLDLDNPGPERGCHLPAVPAVEFLADIYEAEGGESLTKAVEVCSHPLEARALTDRSQIWKRLASELDTVRKKYVSPLSLCETAHRLPVTGSSGYAKPKHEMRNQLCTITRPLNKRMAKTQYITTQHRMYMDGQQKSRERQNELGHGLLPATSWQPSLRTATLCLQFIIESTYNIPQLGAQSRSFLLTHSLDDEFLDLFVLR